MSNNKQATTFDLTIIENFSPETVAMLQSFYSRSSKPIRERLESFGQDDELKVKKALAQYYIGYGHASIGDTGSTTIFIEGVSHFVAKAIQDFHGYKGQESSTRYISYENQPYINPYKGLEYEAAVDEVIQAWFYLYHTYLPHVVNGLKQRYPIQEGEKESVWEKAIQARAFDIMRGYLPAASTTQLSWHTDLRQARDNIKKLINHPLKEVRAVIAAIHKDLIDKYSSSFHESDTEQSEWLKDNADLTFYQSAMHYVREGGAQLYKDIQVQDNLNPFLYDPDESNIPTYAHKIEQVLRERPKKQQLPRYFESLGSVQFRFYIDFGSWRDLQRHRNAIIPMPNMANTVQVLNLHVWYIQQVQDNVNSEVWDQFAVDLSTIMEMTKALGRRLKTEYPDMKDEVQYLVPLGTQVQATLACSLPQLVYMLELRTGQTVHPTLRAPMIQIAQWLHEYYPNITVYADFDDDKWSIKRGTQDIVKKEDM
jgi:thymidylate synthase ThyX